AAPFAAATTASAGATSCDRIATGARLGIALILYSRHAQDPRARRRRRVRRQWIETGAADRQPGRAALARRARDREAARAVGRDPRRRPGRVARRSRRR